MRGTILDKIVGKRFGVETQGKGGRWGTRKNTHVVRKASTTVQRQGQAWRVHQQANVTGREGAKCGRRER